MFKELRPESLLEDDDPDDEHSAVVLGDPMTKSGTIPPSEERLGPRRVSSFGPPKAGRGRDEEGRSSLYERLMRAGALDEVLGDEEEHFDPRLPLTPLPEAPPLEAPPTPLSLFANFGGLAEELEPSRESAEQLRDSEIDILDDDLFSGARSESSPISHHTDPRMFAAPPPAANAAVPVPPRVAPLPPRLPRSMATGQVPSVVLGPGASTRSDATSRVAPIPSTHPLANTTHPVANTLMPVAHTLPPAQSSASRRTPWWQLIMAAVVLLGIGVGLGRLQQQLSEDARPATQPSSASGERSANVATTPRVEERANVDSAESRPVAEPAEKNAAEVATGATSTRRSPAGAAEADLAHATSRAAKPDDTRAEPGEEEIEEEADEAQAAVPKPAAEVASDPNLPAQPSRDAVVSAMSAIAPELAACTGDKHGLATVTLTVRGAGAVSHALVTGMFAGSPEGSCIARAVKLARFEPFREPSIRITYPFQL